MKKRFKKIFLGLTLGTIILGSNAFAYNYKFPFDLNTGFFNMSTYTDYAYKYTKFEPPVLRVDFIESSVRMNFVVVNSNKDARTGVVTTRSTYSGVFSNDSTAQNYKYAVKIWTDDGNFYNRYNVRGSWNPDSY